MPPIDVPARLFLASVFAIATTACAGSKSGPAGGPSATREAGEVRLDVEITGIEDSLLANVEALTGIVHAADSRGLRPGSVYRMHERAPEQIALALEPYGLYSPTIRSSLDDTSDPWKASYAVDPGPPTLLSRVSVRVDGEAMRDSVFRTTLDSLPLAPGDTLNHVAYEKAKQTLALLAADRGYLDAAWDSSLVRVDRDRATAEIVLHMTSGPRFFFGPLSIDQEDWVDTDILVPLVQFETGDPYNSLYLRDLQSDLAGTPYFASVEIVPRRDLADEELRVPIEIHVTLPKTQRWEVGLGYGTDTGPRLRLATEFRRLSRAGHYADLDARLSTTEQTVAVRYNIPTGFPVPSLWSVTGRLGRIEWVTSKTLQGIVGVSWAHMRGDVREVLSLRYQGDDFSVAADTAKSYLTQPIAAWTWASADNRLYATRGIGGTLELRGAVDGFASSASFFRSAITTKAVVSLTPRVRLVTGVDAGYLETSQFHDLPPSIRFFAGGDRSIRGYDYQALGPLDEQGDVTGGNSLLVGSLEVEYRLLEKWSLAAFVDAGNAFDDFRGDIAVGVGPGIRWISPVGLIRLDLGYGLDRPEDERPLRLHLSIGPDF